MSPPPDVAVKCFPLLSGRLAIDGLLAFEAFLLVSERLCWFDFNQNCGTAVGIGLVAIGLAIVSVVIWAAVAPIFRRRWQFRLRTLLSFSVAVALWGDLLATEIGRERKQSEAAIKIALAGGGADARPTWLGRLLRDDSLVEIHSVVFEKTPIDDAALVHLQGLTQLGSLTLGKTEITDAGLIHLRGLKRLNRLWLNNTDITDAGLANISELEQLRYLRLDGTKITDNGLVHLREMKQLHDLSLHDTQIGDAGLAHLQGLKELKFLRHGNTRITEAGLKCLPDLVSPLGD